MQASSSSSAKLENERKDEQEQIIVARALAKLCPPDMKKSTVQNDRYHGRQRSAPIHQDMRPTSSRMPLYPMQYPSWPYHHYSPEMTMYSMWQPQQPYQQQNCLLTLPVAPSPPGPQILPLVHSLFQPDHAQYVLARDKEPISVVASIPASASAPSHVLSNRAMPIHVRSRSQVTIQEIQEERTQEGEDWPQSDAKSDGNNVKIESNSPVFPRFEVQSPASSKTIVEPLLQEKPLEDQRHCRTESNTGHSAQQERISSEQFKWSSQSPKETAPGCGEFLLSSSDSFDSSTSKLALHSPRPSSGGVPKYCTKPSNAAPVRIKTVGASVPSVNPRPESLKAWVPTPSTFRTEAPACSARPRLMRTGGMFSTNFMAPAVQIRSVVPVCSAPPSKMPEPGQEGLRPISEKNKESEDVTAASSELDKLRI
ncbi:hypothetical protein AQUCO_00300881v1 [Aquilegia coerulea]|nr:hypothetical protein AQUCO_00300881v1 [Aquilegia coerulea]